MNHANENFNHARTKLTLFYVGILLCIVFVFSLFLSIAQNNDYRRIVVQQDFGKTVPRRFTKFQNRMIASQVRELRTSFIYELIIIDSAILLVGGVLSYFFAGKTLKPVSQALINQENFLADASHELRTPLAAIQTAIEVVLRKEQKSSDIYKETLIDVQDEVGRMRNLLEELLLLSRIDMNQLTLPLHKISLTDIVKKTSKEMKPLIEKKGLTLHEILPEEVTIMGNNERVQQLLVILLDNAIKYTPKGGEITVSVANDSQPELKVQDSGKGIPLEKQKDIFKRFYQADHSHTGHGAGLGLSIAEAIMKLHKGSIAVKSELEKGSTFICSFP